MSASLVEMVMAIALSGLIFAGALIPVTQTVFAYQESEAELQRSGAQYLAAQRFQRIAASIWRSGDPPTDHDGLKTATVARLEVGDWDIRQKKTQLQQSCKGGGPAVLAQPVAGFALTYRLDNGKWVTSVKTKDLDQVVAVRYEWDDGSAHTYCGAIVTTDRALAGHTLDLPKPDSPKVYRRKDYEQTIKLKLEPWK